ncbi:SDR family oxidoreductase [Georgenia yuyongxinii]|uniref:SDR family oxidoreductase n=1 Tax=Georgenia yuyongxinii TaxID=2589797 RepID=A0A5B8C526_9MICO|nr:SDR family oxidoreductase [Georgenia yuyongxinii]QDC25110.1 SDR family oxidoreductase [Georgenia yuyongxinii]
MRATFDATGHVLVVTGGASGIGAAVAREYATAGGHAVVLDVAEGPSTDGVEHVHVDVADRDAVHAAVEQIVDRHGRIDGLVAGAAVQPRVPVLEMDAETWRRTLAINLDGVVWACQAVVPHMVRRRSGSVVAFASGLARTGHAEASAYAASKAALVAFLQSLAAEVAEHRVRVNTVFPGVIDTPQMRAANPPGPEYEQWLRTTGVGVAADVVGPLMYLMSDAATMTGSTLTRDRVFSKEEK